jgi:hypothetical protein
MSMTRKNTSLGISFAHIWLLITVVTGCPITHVSLKNGLEEKIVKLNVKKLYFKRVQTTSEYIRRLEDEKSSPLVGWPFL